MTERLTCGLVSRFFTVLRVSQKNEVAKLLKVDRPVDAINEFERDKMFLRMVQEAGKLSLLSHYLDEVCRPLTAINGTQATVVAVDEFATMAKAVRGISDDFMTSDTHHPGYVLIPATKFSELQAAEHALGYVAPSAPSKGH